MVVIFIVNWNGIYDTKECLESLQKSKYDDFIIFLLDNNSEDDSWKILQDKYGKNDRIKLFQSDQNLGFTGGNNYLFEYLKFSDHQPKYIILLNNDTVVTEEWLGNLVSFAESTDSYMVSSKMIQYFSPTTMDNAGHYMLPFGDIWPIGYGKSINLYSKTFDNIGPCAGAGLYRFDLFKKIGFFDTYFSTGYEDAELGLRATQLGFQSLFCPDAIVYHKGGQSINKTNVQLWKAQTQKNILYTYFKVLPLSYILKTFPVVFSKFMLAGFLSVFIKKYDIYNTGLRLFFKDLRKVKEARHNFKTLKNALRQTSPY